MQRDFCEFPTLRNRSTPYALDDPYQERLEAQMKVTGRAAVETVGCGFSNEGVDWYTTPYPIYTRHGCLVLPAQYGDTLPDALVKAKVTLVRHFDPDRNQVNAYFDVQEVTILETRGERMDREWEEGEPHRQELEEMFARMVDSEPSSPSDCN